MYLLYEAYSLGFVFQKIENILEKGDQAGCWHVTLPVNLSLIHVSSFERELF